MRWLRSLPFTLPLISAGRELWGRLGGNPGAVDPPSILTASHGGSTLPWYTPIVVSLTLLGVAFAYWWRHRPHPPADDGEISVDPDRLEERLPCAPELRDDGAASPPRDSSAPRVRGIFRPESLTPSPG